MSQTGDIVCLPDRQGAFCDSLLACGDCLGQESVLAQKLPGVAWYLSSFESVPSNAPRLPHLNWGSSFLLPSSTLKGLCSSYHCFPHAEGRCFLGEAYACFSLSVRGNTAWELSVVLEGVVQILTLKTVLLLTLMSLKHVCDLVMEHVLHGFHSWHS